MLHETIQIQSSVPNTYAIITTGNGLSTRSNQAARNEGQGIQRAETPRLQSRLTRSLEVLLGSLRGESLVAAMLAYGLGLRLSDLITLRVQDICLKSKSIFLMDQYRALPEIVLDDLREHMHEKICGCEASTALNETGSDSPWGRDDYLFSANTLDTIQDAIQAIWDQGGNESLIPKGAEATDHLDAALKILGWFHRRRAAQCGIVPESPLELFNKGPRIVRRGRGGSVNAYYVWRAGRELF